MLLKEPIDLLARRAALLTVPSSGFMAAETAPSSGFMTAETAPLGFTALFSSPTTSMFSLIFSTTGFSRHYIITRYLKCSK